MNLEDINFGNIFKAPNAEHINLHSTVQAISNYAKTNSQNTPDSNTYIYNESEPFGDITFTLKDTSLTVHMKSNLKHTNMCRGTSPVDDTIVIPDITSEQYASATKNNRNICELELKMIVVHRLSTFLRKNNLVQE